MPPQLAFDISNVDLTKVAFDMDVVRQYNPQRGDMEHLNGFVYLNYDHGIGFKDVRENEFWVPGHLPGRPLLPGVIMIEAAAQASSFVTKKGMNWEGFIGFGGVDKVKFRQQVTPGQRILLPQQDDLDAPQAHLLHRAGPGRRQRDLRR
ncbi:MAG: hypothetical protein QM770_13085 [Tepidisphaeraceae bacterium]